MSLVAITLIDTILGLLAESDASLDTMGLERDTLERQLSELRKY